MDTARGVGYYGRGEVRLTGHEVYWRKCTRKEPEGIALPDWTRDSSNVVEVLAVGPKCGTVENNQTKRKLYDWPHGQVFPVKPGDFVILPDSAETITHPDVDYEGIIHELDIIAIIE